MRAMAGDERMGFFYAILMKYLLPFGKITNLLLS
jgi:hypothetical protein